MSKLPKPSKRTPPPTPKRAPKPKPKPRSKPSSQRSPKSLSKPGAAAPRTKPQIGRPASAPRSPDARSVAKALDLLDAAHRSSRERGEQLLAVADGLRQAGRDQALATLVADLNERQILRDIAGLLHAMEQLKGTLPAPLSPFHLLPRALHNWLADALALTPDRSIGEEFTMDSSRLSRFQVVGDPTPAAEAGPARVRVVAAGWKRAGVPLVPPAIEILSDRRSTSP